MPNNVTLKEALKYHDMVDQLVKLEEGLTQWEVDFVESISHYKNMGVLTHKQVIQLERIYESHC